MTTEDKINWLLDEFDFERVHRAMTALDWVWADCEGVPNVAQARRCARELLNSVKNYVGGGMATGGFYAENRGGDLYLSFRLDEVDTTDLGKTV